MLLVEEWSIGGPGLIMHGWRLPEERKGVPKWMAQSPLARVIVLLLAVCRMWGEKRSGKEGRKEGRKARIYILNVSPIILSLEECSL